MYSVRFDFIVCKMTYYGLSDPVTFTLSSCWVSASPGRFKDQEVFGRLIFTTGNFHPFPSDSGSCNRMPKQIFQHGNKKVDLIQFSFIYTV